MDNTLLTVSSRAIGNETAALDDPELVNVSLCSAAQICANAAKPLFKYWLQLPQNNDMILTILERLIIGFIGTVKEEVDNVSWALLGYQDQNKKKIVQYLRENGLFLKYRRWAYGDNVHVVDKSDIGIVAQSSSSSSNIIKNDTITRGRSNTNGDDSTCARKEVLLWSTYSVLRPNNGVIYPTYIVDDKGKVSGDKMIKNFDNVRTLGSIIRGCDWLANKICNDCADVIKSETEKVMYNQAGKNAVIRKQSASQVRHELIERTSLIRHTVHQSAKDLSKVATEGLAVLRGEVQIACFHYLFPLVRQQYASNIVGKDFDGEDIVEELSRYLDQVHRAVSCSLPAQAVAVIFAPLCKLVPYILLLHFRDAIDVGSIPFRGFDRTKPFKVIVAAQKSMNLLLHRLGLSQDSLFILEEALASSFEHVRRYVTLLDMRSFDLNHYIKANIREYTPDEFYSLFRRVQEGASRNEFDAMCQDNSSSQYKKKERSAHFG